MHACDTHHPAYRIQSVRAGYGIPTKNACTHSSSSLCTCIRRARSTMHVLRGASANIDQRPPFALVEAHPASLSISQSLSLSFSVSFSLYTYIHTHTHTHTHMQIAIMHTCAHTHACIHTNVHTRTHKHTHACIRTHRAREVQGGNVSHHGEHGTSLMHAGLRYTSLEP